MHDALPVSPAPAHAMPMVASAAEQRAAPRFTILIRAAKLRCGEAEFLCIVRDASETGISLRLFHPLPEGQELELELQNGDGYPLELVWQSEDRAGLKFRQPVDIARIIECPSRFAKRPVRAAFCAPVRLVSGAVEAEATLYDISQQGAKIVSPTRFAIDQRVRLCAPHLGEVHAKVRWRDGVTYGLVFEDTFQFGDMARIVAAMQGYPASRVVA